MTFRRILLPAALVFAVAAAPATATTPGFHHLMSGPLAAGGSWELAIQRSSISGVRGICLDLTPTFADGSSPGDGSRCIAGSLAATKGIAPVITSSASDDVTTSSLVGGVVTSKARRVRITFADGKTLKVKTKKAPKRWRRALLDRVRYFGADALAVSASDPKRIAIYDRAGHRLARISL